MESIVVDYRIGNIGQYNMSLFKDHRFIYAVSVGNEHFENDWVSGYVNFLKKVNPKNTCVLVADTLQRHNLANYYENPNEVAEMNGQIWAKKYQPLFNELANVQCDFLHWEEFRQHPHFAKYLQWMYHLLENDPKFMATLHETIDGYLRRPMRNELNCTMEEREQRSMEYFLEEGAAICIMAENPEIKGILYPNKAPKVMSYVFDLINEDTRKENPFLFFELRPKKQKKERNADGA